MRELTNSLVKKVEIPDSIEAGPVLPHQLRPGILGVRSLQTDLRGPGRHQGTNLGGPLGLRHVALRRELGGAVL